MLCSWSARIASVARFGFLGLATRISIVIAKCSLAQDQSRFSFTLTWINVITMEGYAICPLSVARILLSLKSLFPALLVSKKNRIKYNSKILRKQAEFQISSRFSAKLWNLSSIVLAKNNSNIVQQQKNILARTKTLELGRFFEQKFGQSWKPVACPTSFCAPKTLQLSIGAAQQHLNWPHSVSFVSMSCQTHETSVNLYDENISCLLAIGDLS